jgi:hypothetical protein
MIRQTLDIDHNSLMTPERLFAKLMKCKDLYSVESWFSSSMNGYHVVLWCQCQCDKCRIVFDDPKRFGADTNNRMPQEQNVLFQKKKIIIMSQERVI